MAIKELGRDQRAFDDEVSIGASLVGIHQNWLGGIRPVDLVQMGFGSNHQNQNGVGCEMVCVDLESIVNKGT